MGVLTHRTKKDVEFNEGLLDKLWNKSYRTERIATVSFSELVEGGYKGSMPLNRPTEVGKKFLIWQNSRKRNSPSMSVTYSVFKIK